MGLFDVFKRKPNKDLQKIQHKELEKDISAEAQISNTFKNLETMKEEAKRKADEEAERALKEAENMNSRVDDIQRNSPGMRAVTYGAVEDAKKILQEKKQDEWEKKLQPILNNLSNLQFLDRYRNSEKG